VVADYAAEMVRQTLFEKYGDVIYNSGYKAVTTLLRKQQSAADKALWRGVTDYDQRHGYRGAERQVSLPAEVDARNIAIADALDDIDPVNDMTPAVVVHAGAESVRAQFLDGSQTELNAASLKWLAASSSKAREQIKPGAVIRLQQLPGSKQWRLAQLPEVEGAMIALNPDNGAITALIGGYDFNRNKFNHVTQAWRQPGSSFKPFIYSAALEKGYTPATIIDDAPLTLSAGEAGGTAWEPKNYDGVYNGPVRMRTALTKSLNLVSIRILQAIGPNYARDYIRRFGFDPARHPPYLTMALGAGSVTPLQMAAAYGVFANGGYGVKPYLIERVYDGSNHLLMQAAPQRVGVNAPRVLDPRNAFLMTNMMQDVVRYGTAARASQLGRSDIAGKTGTTNDERDGWFAGYNPSLVAIAWLGFDQPRSLGGRETGAQAALPIWINFMAEALKPIPQHGWAVPNGVVSATINPATGQPIGDADTSNGVAGMTEYFYQENVPQMSAPAAASEPVLPLVPEGFTP
jgi:penicillin-binding protein 1A